jgi:hypothetical protein
MGLRPHRATLLRRNPRFGSQTTSFDPLFGGARSATFGQSWNAPQRCVRLKACHDPKPFQHQDGHPGTRSNRLEGDGRRGALAGVDAKRYMRKTAFAWPAASRQPRPNSSAPLATSVLAGDSTKSGCKFYVGQPIARGAGDGPARRGGNRDRDAGDLVHRLQRSLRCVAGLVGRRAKRPVS